ncbi:MAG: hypothetical protein KDD64_07505 [Bdellovibrionales bacterium]|nr:hypothetical protein [Bdellovibrionales bacterium]
MPAFENKPREVEQEAPGTNQHQLDKEVVTTSAVDRVHTAMQAHIESQLAGFEASQGAFDNLLGEFSGAFSTDGASAANSARSQAAKAAAYQLNPGASLASISAVEQAAWNREVLLRDGASFEASNSPDVEIEPEVEESPVGELLPHEEHEVLGEDLPLGIEENLESERLSSDLGIDEDLPEGIAVDLWEEHSAGQEVVQGTGIETQTEIPWEEQISEQHEELVLGDDVPEGIDVELLEHVDETTEIMEERGADLGVSESRDIPPHSLQGSDEQIPYEETEHLELKPSEEMRNGPESRRSEMVSALFIDPFEESIETNQSIDSQFETEAVTIEQLMEGEIEFE